MSVFFPLPRGVCVCVLIIGFGDLKTKMKSFFFRGVIFGFACEVQLKKNNTVFVDKEN